MSSRSGRSGGPRSSAAIPTPSPKKPGAAPWHGCESLAPMIWRSLRRAFAVLGTVCALVGVIRLVVPADSGARRQLAFLRAELGDGAGERAQELFPEGYFFLHALYGLAWVDVGLD